MNAYEPKKERHHLIVKGTYTLIVASFLIFLKTYCEEFPHKLNLKIAKHIYS